jgi:uncharacterized membrane protein YgcG
MARRPDAGIILLLAAISILWVSPAFGQNDRTFPEITTDITDLAGVLTEEQKLAIADDLKFLRDFHNMPGVILLVKETPEWDFIEYGHDLFDHLRAQGKLDESSFLIYLSINDRKMAFILGDDIDRVTDPQEKRGITNELGATLGNGEYYAGLTKALARLKALPGPEDIQEAKKLRGQWMIVAGLVILIAVFYMNLMKRRMKRKPEY